MDAGWSWLLVMRVRRLCHRSLVASCMTCLAQEGHSRRVRCLRSDATDPTCDSCRRRHTACLTTRAKYKLRSGRNLEAAKAAFGGEVAEPTSLVKHASSSIRPSVISSHTAEARLGQAELSESLMAHLVGDFVDTSKYE